MSSLTNERLRYWLSTNQAARERLCAGLMPVLGDYRDVRPRRPEGGPDGGRDLDAVFQGGSAAIAIGFRNNVRDDDADKKWVRSKVASDASTAVRSGAKHFAFVTNVDLTPTEISEIRKSILDRGFGSCDVIHRERLRLALDSPQGFALRAMHLEIPLDTSEQATFFAKFAEKINEDASSEILARLARIELKQDIQDNIDRVTLRFTTTANWWQALVGTHIQITFCPFSGARQGCNRNINFVFRRPKRSKTEQVGLRWLRAEACISGYTDEGVFRVAGCTKLNVFSQKYTSLEISAPAEHFTSLGSSTMALAELDKTWWSISVSEAAASSISKISLVAGGWVLGYIQRDNDPLAHPAIPNLQSELTWPMKLHSRERLAGLVGYGSLLIDFRRIRPERA